MKNLIIVLLALVCAYLYFFKPKEKEAAVIERLPKEVVDDVNVEVDRITKKIDSEGVEHALISETDNFIRSYEHLKDSARREMDSITRLLDIKNKQLKEYVSYNATLKDSLLRATHQTDTSYVYEDKYAKIEFNVPNKYFNFSYDARVNYATYYKRDWFLGPKKHYVDLWVSDPRATINGVKRLKIQPDEPFFKADFKASAFYADQVHVGSQAGVHLGRVRLGAGYYFNTTRREWLPIYTAEYKILDF